MRILSRYVLVRLVAPFGFALAALTGFMLLNQVARRFDSLAGKGLEWTVIGEVFLLCIPFILALTLPMAVLVAVLFSFSNLAADSEITAMRASGVSVPQLVRPVFVWALLMAVFTFGFVDQVLPRSNARLRTLLFDISRKSPTFQLNEQVVNTIPESQYFLSAGAIDQVRGMLRDVAIYDLSGQFSRRIVYADSGTMTSLGGGRHLQLVLHSGTVHEFRGDDESAFRLTGFLRNEVILRDVQDSLERRTGDVIRGDREMSTCEMLEVVRTAGSEISESSDRRAALLQRDLAVILGQTPEVAEPGETPPGPLPIYCTLVDRVQALVLPKTAEAQVSAQKNPAPRVTVTTSELSAWPEVNGAAANERNAHRRADKYLVEVHKKFAIAAACIPFVLIAIVLALRFPRGGMGLVIGGAMAVFSVFWVGLTAGEALADKGYIRPWLAMWSPNIILALLGILGLMRVNRESGSTRGGDWEEITQWAGDLVRKLRPAR
ncbi:MAG TPA: LptF/LptG family permease [Gemmatimonadales bacterium]|nr:LptF/LptG family permease [Gemmatimonadales bacterium]